MEDPSRRNFLVGAGIAATGGFVSSVTPPSLIAHASASAVIGTNGSLFPRFEGFGQPTEDKETFWAKVRSRFPLDPSLTFLNNGTFGPPSDFVIKTRERYDALMAADPRDCFRMKELAEVRASLASFIHASDAETAITHSTTEGLNIFARGIDWKEGDEVILGDQEHFAAVEPYQMLAQRYGIKIVSVNIPLPAQDMDEVVAAYARAFSARTRVLVVSHVSYVTGLVASLRELAELAHKHGALISVDGAQSFGVLPVDVTATNIDHFASGGQKWLLAGTGTGVCYIRKDLQPEVWPLFGHDDPVHKASPSPRYERCGQISIAAAVGIAAALQFHEAIGSERIEQRARQLGLQVREAVQAIPGAKLLSSCAAGLNENINVFTLPNLPAQQVVAALNQQERIVIRAVSPGQVNALRVSTHFYNSPEEVARLMSVLERWSKNPTEIPETTGAAA